MRTYLSNLISLRRIRNTFLAVVLLFVAFVLFDRICPFEPVIQYSAVIEDRHGKVIHAFLAEDQQWRMKASQKDVSEIIKKALLSKEDQWFYYHPGVNPLAIVRAASYNIFTQRRMSGASTITMQLARMLRPAPRTYFSKLKEMIHALQLEWHYSKDEILEMYLNKVPYGGNIEGVKAAALLYFNRQPNHLSIAQAALLAVVPNRPVTMRPGKNDSLLTIYRNKWLKKLQLNEVFTEKEIADALIEPLGAKRLAAPQQMPHLANWLKKQSAEPVIKTTIHADIQAKSELLLHNHMNRMKAMQVYNAAVVIINNQTHELITYIGSADNNDLLHNGKIDAAKALRSPGSTLKPLIYATCFDNGLLTPKTVMMDVPENYDGYAPENYDSRFNGRVTVEEALCKSLNMPAVKALQMVGKNTLLDKLRLAGCEEMGSKKQQLGLSLALGGCEMSLYELVGLYSIYANEGKYIPIKCRLGDSSLHAYPVISKESAFMVADMLGKLTRPDLPEIYKSNPHLPKVAWKTGTSYGRRDAWSIGFNSKYTIGVWIGNCTGRGVNGLTGTEVATPLLFDLFNTIDYNSDGSWIKPPKSLAFRLVCSITGKLPSEHCEHQVADFYIPAVSSMERCNHLISLKVNPTGTFSYCESCCPEFGYQIKKYENIEPSLAAYFDEQKIKYTHLPPHSAACSRMFEGKAPLITLPVNKQKYMIEKGLNQLMELHASTPADVATVYWYVNDRFLRQAKPDEKVFFEPEAGAVKISCADDKGRASHVEITVQWF